MKNTNNKLRAVALPGLGMRPQRTSYTQRQDNEGFEVPNGVVVQCPCSAWDDSGKVMAEADTLEELIQLKLENPGMTRAAALEWALEMRRMYQPNDKDVQPKERQ